MLYNNRVEGYSPLDNVIALDVKTDPKTLANAVTRAIGTSTLEQLRQSLHVQRPSLLEKDMDEKMQEVREIIQRKFVGERNKNRDDFAAYIQELNGGRHGALPAITFFTKEAMVISDDGVVHIKNLEPVIAIDGETQLDALFLAAETNPEIARMPLAFIIHAGISPEHVRIIVHDLNALGRSIKESEVASLNATSPIVKEIEKGLNTAGFSMKDVDRSGNGTGTKKNPKVSSFTRLASLAAGVHTGPTRMGERLDGFLSTFSHESACNSVNLPLIGNAVAMFAQIPWEVRRELGSSEMRVLGALAQVKGETVVNETTARAILANKAGAAKGKRGNARLAALMHGL